MCEDSITVVQPYSNSSNIYLHEFYSTFLVPGSRSCVSTSRLNVVKFVRAIIIMPSQHTSLEEFSDVQIRAESATDTGEVAAAQSGKETHMYQESSETTR